jgi:hypothetical protein
MISGMTILRFLANAWNDGRVALRFLRTCAIIPHFGMTDMEILRFAQKDKKVEGVSSQKRRFPFFSLKENICTTQD